MSVCQSAYAFLSFSWFMFISLLVPTCLSLCSHLSVCSRLSVCLFVHVRHFLCLPVCSLFMFVRLFASVCHSSLVQRFLNVFRSWPHFLSGDFPRPQVLTSYPENTPIVTALVAISPPARFITTAHAWRMTLKIGRLWNNIETKFQGWI